MLSMQLFVYIAKNLQIVLQNECVMSVYAMNADVCMIVYIHPSTFLKLWTFPLNFGKF